MNIKKASAILAASAILMSTLAGCEKPVNVGSSASTIEVDRGAYFAQKNNVKAQDISNVIEFIDSIEKIAGDIGAYTTSYDPDTSTVYATTDDGNIAFYLDDQGYVMFASANGTLETKTKLNQAIVEVTIGNAFKNGINDVFNMPEQKKWLNEINANVVAAEVDDIGVSIESLDPTIMYFDTPALDAVVSSDLERDVFGVGVATMPVLTEELEEYGIMDLTNYYEAPNLSKFWSPMDTSKMEENINELMEQGQSMSDEFYENATLENPGEEVPEWSLGSYKLPSEFSDGTSTTLGEETAEAYEQFYSDLKAWRDEVFDDELAAQQDGIASILEEASDNSAELNVSDFWSKYSDSLKDDSLTIDMPSFSFGDDDEDDDKDDEKGDETEEDEDNVQSGTDLLPAPDSSIGGNDEDDDDTQSGVNLQPAPDSSIGRGEDDKQSGANMEKAPDSFVDTDDKTQNGLNTEKAPDAFVDSDEKNTGSNTQKAPSSSIGAGTLKGANSQEAPN